MSARRHPPKPPTDGTDTKPSLRIVATPGQGDDDGEGDTETLSAREIMLCDALASGQTLAQAAKAIGLSERSARRWKAKAPIAEAIRNRLAENVSVGRAIMSSGFARASRALVDMSDGAQEGSAVQVSSARAVVEAVTRLTDLADIERQIAELKAELSDPSTFNARKGF